MAATKAPRPVRARGGGATPKLPPITVGKFEDIGRLLERVVAENQALFIEKGQSYKDAHRQGSSRPLTPLEAAQVAASIDTEDKVALAERLQASELRAYDEPGQREVLLASGIGTAAAVVEAFRDVVALVEMPVGEYEAAYDEHTRTVEVVEKGADGEEITRTEDVVMTLADEIEAAAKELRKLELGAARKRTTAAMEHFARSAGFDPGEAWSLPVKAVWQALTQATETLNPEPQSSQLTGSAVSTPGLGEKSDG